MADKKKKEEKQEENSKENLPKDDSQKDNLNINLEDLEDLLDQIKKDYNLDGKNVKIVRVEKRKLSRKEKILSVLVTYLFDFVLLVSLSGYLGFNNDILKLLAFSIVFSTVESILRSLMMYYFMKLMYLSLGTISIPITIFAFIITMLILPISFNDKFILFIIIFLLLRVIMKMLMMKRSREKFMNKIKGEKK